MLSIDGNADLQRLVHKFGQLVPLLTDKYVSFLMTGKLCTMLHVIWQQNLANDDRERGWTKYTLQSECGCRKRLSNPTSTQEKCHETQKMGESQLRILHNIHKRYGVSVSRYQLTRVILNKGPLNVVIYLLNEI